MIKFEVEIKPIKNVPIINTTSQLVMALRKTVGSYMVTVYAEGNKIIFNVPEQACDRNPNFFTKEGLEEITNKFYEGLVRNATTN